MRALLPLALAAALLLPACGDAGSGATGADPGGLAAESSGPHVHRAPHGGVLVEVGEHAANVELLLDRTSGTLALWVLDGHAENAVRLVDGEVPVEVSVGGESMVLRLEAVESALSGEKKGDTSRFAVTHRFLAGIEGTVTVTIPRIVVRGVEGLALQATID